MSATVARGLILCTRTHGKSNTHATPRIEMVKRLWTRGKLWVSLEIINTPYSSDMHIYIINICACTWHRYKSYFWASLSTGLLK